MQKAFQREGQSKGVEIKMDTSEGYMDRVEAKGSKFASCYEEATTNFEEALKSRIISKTTRNKNSSRSHLIVKVTISYSGGKLEYTFVDLAGLKIRCENLHELYIKT